MDVKVLNKIVSNKTYNDLSWADAKSVFTRKSINITSTLPYCEGKPIMTTSRWRRKHDQSWIGRFTVLKMWFHSQMICRLNKIPFHILKGPYMVSDKPILNLMCKSKKPRPTGLLKIPLPDTQLPVKLPKLRHRKWHRGGWHRGSREPRNTAACSLQRWPCGIPGEVMFFPVSDYPRKEARGHDFCLITKWVKGLNGKDKIWKLLKGAKIGD